MSELLCRYRAEGNQVYPLDAKGTAGNTALAGFFVEAANSP